MRTTDLLDLLRIPNVVTAAGDVVAAAAVASAGGVPLEWPTVAMTAGASACFYTGGMALNDVADAAVDARERPSRPIPSGRVTRAEAASITVVLFAAGLALAWAAGVIWIATGLLGSIVLYDLVLAGRPGWGPAGMAACRGLNLSMGLLAVGAWSPTGGGAVAILAGYVFGLTHLSLGETGGGARQAVGVAGLTTVAASLGVIGLGRLTTATHTWLDWVALLAVIALFLGRTLPRLAAAARQPTPNRVGPAVGILVTCILWLDASLAVGLAGAAWLLAFLPLAAIQEWLRRTYRVT